MKKLTVCFATLLLALIAFATFGKSNVPETKAEALAVQEREPTGKARAEMAEIWGWMKRNAIF